MYTKKTLPGFLFKEDLHYTKPANLFIELSWKICESNDVIQL
jgi:hypothetical protein